MTKYHITPSGEAKECYASVSNCPFGSEDEHYSTQSEARYAYETRGNAEFGAISSLSDVFRSTPLKEMDPSMLSRSLIHEAKQAGIHDVSKLEEAIDVATILHKDQRRKNRGDLPKTSYIEHPLRNSIRLLRLGVKDEETIVSSVLHDTVEDGADTFAEKFNAETAKTHTEQQKRDQLLNLIGNRYGESVKQTVYDVSNPLLSESEKKVRTHKEKAADYNDRVENSISKNPRAYLVKLSDWMDNAAGLHHNDVEGNNSEKIVKQAQKYIPTADIFKRHSAQLNGYLDSERQEDTLRKIDKGVERLENIVSKKR